MKRSRFYLFLLFACMSVYGYANNPEDATVWGNDGKNGGASAYADGWYDNSSSSLTIESAEQLGSFIKALNESNTFEGQTVVLTADLDMNAYQWAASTNGFKGTFDGGGHTISNLKSGDAASPWAFIGAVDGGEVRNVIIDAVNFTGNGEVGGIVGTLSNGGKVANSAFVGSLMTTQPEDGGTVKTGGIVGSNDGGQVEGCFVYPSALNLAEGTAFGNIAGTSAADAVTNSYFLVNHQYGNRSVGEDASTEGLGEMTDEAFAGGEVAWLLNQTSGDKKWSVDGTRPVFATETNRPVYKVSYTETEQGKVEGTVYVKEGETVALTLVPTDGYLPADGYDVTGAELEITDNTFVMPAADITVAGRFVEYAAPVVLDATETGSSRFTANWEAAAQGATEYLLTVMREDGTTLDAYNELSVGEVTSYEVTNLLPETTYIYKVYAKTGDYVSKWSEEMAVQTLTGPVISYSPVVGIFTLGGETSGEVSQTITVVGSNLENGLTFRLSGENADCFSLSAETLPMTGGALKITYASSVLGSHTAVLTISSEGAEDVSISLNGVTEVAAPKVTVAAVGKTVATVKWNPAYLVDSYVVTLTGNGQEVEETTQECTFVFTGLLPGKAYTCTVSSLAGEERVAGEAIAITTTTDYGQQLNNSGFEYWEGEGESIEPVEWNSFMTLNRGFSLANMAEAQQVDSSKVVRPGTTGTTSARIWARNAVIATANGNLTTGRINAGSATAADEANHNYTVITDPDFNEAMNGAKPDSLTVWVRYVPAGEDAEGNMARVSAYIHDTYSFKDPSSDETNNSHIVGKAIMNYPAAEGNGWQRLSIPFDYCGPATSADYMLITFATNMTPGKGSENDSVYIDDMLLIYNPMVEVTSVDKTAYKQGATMQVEYKLEGTMSPTNLNAEPNVVTLQLSDAEGSFDDPLELVSITTDYSGTLTATLPEDLPVGENYRVRIVTTNYPMISEPNANPIGVYEPGVPTITSTLPSAFVSTANKAVSQTLTVEGNELTGAISLTLGQGNTAFSLDKTELPMEGGEVVVTYVSGTLGTDATALTLASAGAEPVLVALSGTTVPEAPVVLAATDVTPVGFTANWEPVAEATEYELTVTKTGGEASVKEVGDVTSFAVEGLTPASEYTYHVVAKVGELVSAASEESEPVAVLPKPVLTVEPAELVFDELQAGQTSEPQVVTVVAESLFGDITVQVDGQDFSAEAAVIAKDAESKTVGITFAPLVAKTANTGTLTLSTPYGDDVTVALSGSSVPKAVTVLPATDVTTTSFTANWEEMEGASYYRLTVCKDGVALSGYNALRVKGATSKEVTGLEPGMLYTYVVTASVNGLESAVSEEMQVTTANASGLDVVDAAGVSVYPSPARETLYIRGCQAVEVGIYSVDGMYVARLTAEENRVDLSDLAAGTYMAIITTEDGQQYKRRFVKR